MNNLKGFLWIVILLNQILVTTLSASELSPVDFLKSYNEASGYNSLPHIKEIEFRFNVIIPKAMDTLKVSRYWRWSPNSDFITSLDTPESHSKQTVEDKAIRAKFVNDLYWLMFPRLALQDSNKVEYKWEQPKILVVKYVDGQGFTPNDTYKLTFDNANNLVHWSYHKASSQEATRASSWGGYQEFGPLKLSTHHLGENGFQVYFDKIKVKLIK